MNNEVISRAEQYDLLRAVLVVLVVLGHATFFSAETQFGSMNYWLLMDENGITDTFFHRTALLISDWIYTFHMPVFMALSGTIYGLQREKGRYANLKVYLKSKALRLLVPLFVVWLFLNIPIKYITGYYNGIAWWKMLLQIVCPRNVYLWFLESLFIIYIIIWFLDKIENVKIRRGELSYG